jgi:hypothetical protein
MASRMGRRWSSVSIPTSPSLPRCSASSSSPSASSALVKQTSTWVEVSSTPHATQVAATVRQFAVRGVDVAPLVGEREDLGDIPGQQAVQRAAAGAVDQLQQFSLTSASTLAGTVPTSPSWILRGAARRIPTTGTALTCDREPRREQVSAPASYYSISSDTTAVACRLTSSSGCEASRRTNLFTDAAWAR